jgi:hypothetical protein
MDKILSAFDTFIFIYETRQKLQTINENLFKAMVSFLDLTVFLYSAKDVQPPLVVLE